MKSSGEFFEICLMGGFWGMMGCSSAMLVGGGELSLFSLQPLSRLMPMIIAYAKMEK
jgi:hypothetical protein